MGEEETQHKSLRLIKENIFFSFLLKGWSGVVQLFLVPFTLFCLGSYKNGLWMTVSSLLLWIDTFDIGLGNGLRNKLAACIAKNDILQARKYVSSTFFMLIMIIIPVCLCLIIIACCMDIYSLLNVDYSLVNNLREVFVMCISLVSATFIFKFIGNVYLGLQLPAVNNALVVGGQTLTLLLVTIMRFTGVHTLMLVAIAYTLSPLLVYLIAWPLTFNMKYQQLRPSLRLVSKSSIEEMLSIGVKFFILQICGVILFASSSTMISHFFSPDAVTPYQISYRYFSFVMMIFTVIAAPFWSATTAAYANHHLDWILQYMRHLHYVVLIIGICLAAMIFLSRWVYPLWVGVEVKVPLNMTIYMAMYMFIIIYSLSYSYIINGFGTLRLQIIFTSIAALVYIPLGYGLSIYMGISGFLLALCIVNIPGAFVNKLQCKKILSGNARGVWIK